MTKRVLCTLGAGAGQQSLQRGSQTGAYISERLSRGPGKTGVNHHICKQCEGGPSPPQGSSVSRRPATLTKHMGIKTRSLRPFQVMLGLSFRYARALRPSSLDSPPAC